MLRIVMASANPDKVAEIAAIMVEEAGGTVELLARPEHVPEVEETAATLVGNARLKAAALVAATGEAAVSDDTGLEVDALGGAPGVISSRWAGAGATYADNVAKLLVELREVRGAGRSARFRTVAMLRFPGGAELAAEGVIEGLIAEAPRGEGGFGYDPVFVPSDGDGRTFAEMTMAEKAVLSHRGRAFRSLADQIARHLARDGLAGGAERRGD